MVLEPKELPLARRMAGYTNHFTDRRRFASLLENRVTIPPTAAGTPNVALSVSRPTTFRLARQIFLLHVPLTDEHLGDGFANGGTLISIS